ncbi:unnamed protein product [Staurois parvus]|uniref:Uncharacterized protein n=1 Tax=Staurois parvus TaxID=386267 RepID=A0ABN9HJW4_9NEOB|nr:unnamed protein product [Staurois parvus]
MPISTTYLIIACQSVPFISASQCHLSVPVSAAYHAHQCHLSVPLSAAYQCQSMPPNSASQCRLSVPVSAAYQCRLSLSYMSAAFQCPSVMPVNAHQCHLPVPPHQCHLSVSISAAYQCPSLQPHLRTSVKEKNHLFTKFYNKKTKKKIFFSKFSVVFSLFK